MVRLAIIMLVAAGCGGLSDMDRQALHDIASDQAAALDLCARNDAGDCNPAMMRALARASYCTTIATLTRHGEPGVDAGVSCERK